MDGRVRQVTLRRPRRRTGYCRRLISTEQRSACQRIKQRRPTPWFACCGRGARQASLSARVQSTDGRTSGGLQTRCGVPAGTAGRLLDSGAETQWPCGTSAMGGQEARLGVLGGDNAPSVRCDSHTRRTSVHRSPPRLLMRSCGEHRRNA